MTEEQETTLIKRSIVLKRNDITWQEVLEHNTSEDCWIVIDNNVYDVTKFLVQHPVYFYFKLLGYSCTYRN